MYKRIKYLIREFLLWAVYLVWSILPERLRAVLANFLKTFYRRHKYAINNIYPVRQHKLKDGRPVALFVGLKPKVSIIIPTFNNPKELGNCLSAIKANTNYDNYEVILIDNNTFDKKALRIMSESGHRVIKYSYKFNFSKMNNLASREAQGDFLLFLNNDTVPQANWLAPMLAEFQKADTGIVGSKLLYSDNTIQHAGMEFDKNLLTFFHPYCRLSSRLKEANFVREVPAVTGACLMIKKSLFEKIGGFDEEYWIESQDVDLCFKVRQLGFKIIFTPLSVLYHDEGATRGLISEDARFHDSGRLRKKWIDAGLILSSGNFSDSMPKKILLIKLISMGDVIMVTPIIEAMRKKYPNSEIVFATSNKYGEILEGNPYLDRLILVRDFDRREFDLEFDYYKSMTLALLYREDWDLVYQIQLLDLSCGYWGTDHHLQDLYADIANVKLIGERPIIKITQTQRDKIQVLFGTYVKSDETVVLLHTTSGWKLKDWDSRKFVQLADMISKKYNVKIFQIGGPDDIIIQSDRVIHLEGKLSLKETAALMERSDLLICPDTGLMHMAAVLGLKIVALFGPTSPSTGGPINGKSYFCIQSDTCCDIPCHMKECRLNKDCAKDIPVEKVFNAVCEMLDGDASDPKSFWKGKAYEGLGREVFNNRSGTGGFRF